MTTLPEFLLARIAEDEAIAEVAEEESAGSWEFDLDAKGRAGFEHITRHDPARVLAECRAKRRIVQEYTDLLKWDADESDDHGIHGQRIGLEFAVKMLALPDADHPDYDESWRP